MKNQEKYPRIRLVALTTVLAAACGSAALAQTPPPPFTIALRGGTFFGPGQTGINPFADGSIRNVTLTGALTGIIPFSNNGVAAPNVAAESDQGGLLDARLSDGTLINENDNGAFVLRLRDPQTERRAVVFVGSALGGPNDGVEFLETDQRGNLALTVDAVTDAGPSTPIGRLLALFTTGAVRVPFSVATQNGLPGGHDAAGPFKSGRVMIGRVGDFNYDGLLDGEFLFSQTSPVELIVGGGEPAFLRRPFFAPLPIPPILAADLTLNGIVQNFPEPLIETVQAGEILTTLEYLEDISGRLDASDRHLRATFVSHSLKGDNRSWAGLAAAFVRASRISTRSASHAFKKGDVEEGVERSRVALAFSGAALHLSLAAGGEPPT